MNEAKIEILSFVAHAWRRRWLALALAWAVCLIGWAVVATMPPRFQASSRIYVDTQSLLSPLMKGMAVNVDLNQQVLIMQRTLLSRPNLESVLRTTDLDLKADTPERREALLKQLQDKTVLRSEGNNLFFVSYESSDPQLAKKVVQALLTIFVEGNLGNNRRDMEQARQFIEDQIRQYEQKLRDAESRLARFRQENLNLLPEKGGSLSLIDETRRSLAGTRKELEDAQTRLRTLNDQLASVPQFLDVRSAPAVIVGGRSEDDIETRIEKAEDAVREMALRYTERHPDLIIARQTLASLKAKARNRASGGPGGAGKETVSNPVYEQIKLKQVETQATVQMLENRIKGLESETQRLEKMAAAVPEVEARFANLNRDYDVIKDQYEQLLQRREAARISQDMDSKADKVIQFRIVDPPEVPLKPSAPNKPLFSTMVLGLGLAVGIAVALALAYHSDAFGSSRQLRDTFDLPVLGSVSATRSSATRRRARMEALRLGLALSALVGLYGVIMAHHLGLTAGIVGRLPI